MTTSIYTDGHSLDITRGQADALLAADILLPHPGRGHDGIGPDDYILAPSATWDDVYALVRPEPYGRGTGAMRRGAPRAE